MLPYFTFNYLSYIDDFTIKFFMLIFFLICAITLVFGLGKFFSWFLNTIFELKKGDNYKRYDTFQD